MNRTTLLRSIFVLVGMMFLVLGCGPVAPAPTVAPPPTSAPLPTSAGAQPAAQPPTTTAPQPTAVPPTVAPVKDTLVIAQSLDAKSLDPFQTTVPYVNVIGAICEPLIYWDNDANGVAFINKRLATDYKQLNDTTLQFKLKPGVTFSNGEPFNADSAKLSFELMFQARDYNQWLTGLLKEVQIVDPMTVNVVLTKPYALAISVIARGSYMIAPKDFQTRGKDVFNQSPVCTGPYVFKDHTVDDHVTLTANPSYWAGTPKFKSIVWRTIPDDNARVAALQAEEIDLATNIPLAAATSIDASKTAKLVSVNGLRQYAVFFDTDNPKSKPLQDVRVRQALNYAIDRASICKQLFAGRCTPLAGQFLSNLHSGYNPDVKAFPFDVAKAKQLLAAAGYANGFQIDYTYTQGRYPQDKQAGEAISSYLRAAGVNVTEKVVDYPEWSRQFNANPRETTSLYTVGFLFGQDGYLSLSAYAPGSRYRTTIVSPAFDAAVAKYDSTTDDAQRIKLLQDAEKASYDDPWAVYLYTLDDLYGVRNWLTGFKPRADQEVLLYDLGVTPK